MRAAAVRDLRIDFVRGIALIMIFINHIQGNFFENFTNKNFGFSDSAEVFVLLAGYASAMAYYHRFSTGQPIETMVRVARRAGHLYTVHILITVLAVALFAMAAGLLSRPELAREINIGPLLDDPARAFVGLATLRHQLGFFNILPLYVVLLLLLPVIMAAYQWDWRALLAGSLAIYLVVGFSVYNLPSYPARHSWFFNPLSWQLLFVAGFIWGTRARHGLGIPYRAGLYWVAVGYLVTALLMVQVPEFWKALPKTDALGALWGFSKTFESPFRLLHVLALAYVVGMSPIARWMNRVTSENLIVQMGQHALPVFACGSLLSMLFHLVRIGSGGGFWIDLLSATAGILVMLMLTSFLVWQSKSPAGQVGSLSASGFVAATPPVPPPAMVSLPPPVR
ncbi:MAG: OpgC domain-containing protein [Hyphomicrobiaceae bacterium]|nr:OpgC domain-containing protein [Hyphomicrobiaceae bacterium]